MPMALRLFTALIIGNPAKSAIAWRNLIWFRVLNRYPALWGSSISLLQGKSRQMRPQCLNAGSIFR